MPILLLLALIAQLPAQSAPPAPPATAILSGRVIDGVTGQPVTGAAVTLALRQRTDGTSPQPSSPRGAPDPINRGVLVDSTGRFLFVNLQGGTYDLTATKRGYSGGTAGRLRPDGAGQSIVLPNQGRRTDVVIRVWKYASLAGTVVDEANEPVVGVLVHALRREWIAGEARLNIYSTATTDDRGAYRIGSLLQGEYIVAVPSTLSTLPAVALDAYASGGSASQDLRNAVSRVASIPQPLGTRDAQRIGDLILHGSTPGLVQPDLGPDGRLQIYPTVFHPGVGAVSDARPIALTAGENRSLSPVQLRLAPSVRVSGVVTGAEAAAPTTLALVPVGIDGFASESGFQAARTMTDAAGAFVFLGVTPGTYRLRAITAASPPPPAGFAAPDYVANKTSTYWLHETITVGARDMSVNVALKPALNISGRLAFEGQRTPLRPDQNTRDMVNASPTDGRSVGTLTGRSLDARNLTFQIAELAAGRYTLRASTPYGDGWFLKSITVRGQDALDAPFDLTEDLTDVVITYTDRQPLLTGTVRTAAGVPDTEALVVLFPADPQRWTEFGRTPYRLRSIRTTATGAYNFQNAPPGDYLIAAIHDSAATSWQSSRFLEALSRQAMRVKVIEGTTVTQDLRRVEVK